MSWTVISQSSTFFRQDRRKAPRVSASIQAELRVEGSTAPTRVETADISAAGMYVQMFLTLEIGSRLDIILWLGGQKHCLKGKVVTKHPQFGNGIEFLSVLPETTAALGAYVDAANDGQPDEPKVQ